MTRMLPEILAPPAATHVASVPAPQAAQPLQRAIQSLTSHAHRLPTTALTTAALVPYDPELRLPKCYEGVLSLEGALTSPIRANQEMLCAMARRAGESRVSECLPFRLSTLTENLPLFASVERLDADDLSALLFSFIHPGDRRLPDPSRLMIWLGLSRTEASIAIEFAQGLCVSEIAKQRSLSELTVRTHLRTIFEKSNTHRQPDLVALLLGLAAI